MDPRQDKVIFEGALKIRRCRRLFHLRERPEDLVLGVVEVPQDIEIEVLECVEHDAPLRATEGG
jgi:hypothetical protein